MKKMRFSLRMKRAGKKVISILTIRKSWISHKIIPFIEPTSDVLTRQLGKPNSKEEEVHQRQGGMHTVSFLWQSLGE